MQLFKLLTSVLLAAPALVLAGVAHDPRALLDPRAAECDANSPALKFLKANPDAGFQFCEKFVKASTVFSFTKTIQSTIVLTIPTEVTKGVGTKTVTVTIPVFNKRSEPTTAEAYDPAHPQITAPARLAPRGPCADLGALGDVLSSACSCINRITELTEITNPPSTKTITATFTKFSSTVTVTKLATTTIKAF